MCALVAFDGQTSMRRGISEMDLLISEEELACAFHLLCVTMVETRSSISEVLVAGFDESERKTSVVYQKVFARARLALPCAAPRDIRDVCLVFRELSRRGAPTAGLMWSLRTPSILRVL